MSQLTITCPSCNETFSADQALQKHLKEKEQKYQEEVKVKEKLLKEKYNLDFKLKEKSLEKELSLKIQEQNKSKFQELRTQIEEAEEEKKTFEKKMQSTLKQKEQALEKNSKEIEAKMNAKLKAKENEIENQLKKRTLDIENDKKREFKELKDRVSEAEKSKKKIEVKYQEDLKKKEKSIEIKHKEKTAIELKKIEELRLRERKEDEIFKKRQKVKIEELTRQLKQKSVEVQGEVQEELIEDYLRDKFPNDTVEEVKKGAKGADCILTINNKDQEKLAQIYFESKDHKSFKEEWVSKLLSDMKDKNINYGVLITTAMPKDFNKDLDGYVERHGKRILIIPMNYQIIHTLVSFIRINLINENKSKKDFNAPKMMKRLWDHIMGPSFQLPVRNLYQTMIKMNDLMGKEKKFFENNMANKERAMLDMEEDFRDMIKSFTLKVGPDCVIQIEDKK